MFLYFAIKSRAVCKNIMFNLLKGNIDFVFRSLEIDNNPIVYSHGSVISFHDFPRENSIAGSSLLGDYSFVECVKKYHITTIQPLSLVTVMFELHQ